MTKITRDQFLEIWVKYNLSDIFYDKIDGNVFTELEEFIVYYDYNTEELSIISRLTLDSKPIIINWYKLMHPGRSLNLVGIKTIKDLDFVLKMLKENLE